MVFAKKPQTLFVIKMLLNQKTILEVSDISDTIYVA